MTTFRTKPSKAFIDAYDPINRMCNDLSIERSKWIDSTIAMWIPHWRLKLLKKYPYKWLSNLLIGDIEIVNEELIVDSGTRVWIKLNGLVIGTRDFKL